MIYIDTGREVIQYCTNLKIESAIRVLLDQTKDLMFTDTIDDMTVELVKRYNGGEQE